MAKKCLLVCMILSLCLSGKAQTVVDVSIAGTLKDYLPAPWSDVTNLKVTGSIDAQDFRTIRNELPNLVNLDISGVTIVAYSGTNGTAINLSNGNDVDSAYSANVIPHCAFYLPQVTSRLGQVLVPEKKLKLQSLQLPSGLQAIGNYAFAKLLDLSSTVFDLSAQSQLATIGDYAFYRDSILTEIKLPSGVIRMGANAFRDCAKLVSFTLPAATTTLGATFLSGCVDVREIKFESPSSITAITNGFFVGMPLLKKAEIPASVTDLSYAFSWSNAYFAGDEIEVDPANTTYASHEGILYNHAKTNLIFCPAARTSATILSTTETISSDAFRQGQLTEITIPSLVRSIGTYAFAESKLEQIHFQAPSHLESVGNYAFYRDTFLLAITLPATLQTIGNNVFDGTSALKNIVLPAGITSIGNYVFAYSGVKSADMSAVNGLTNFGPSAFQDCIHLNSVQLPPNYATLPNNTFLRCDSLKSLILPSAITAIGNSAFASCGIETLTLPEGLLSIGSDAFSLISSLSSLHIPKTVTTLTSGYSGSPFNRSGIRITVDPENTNYLSLNGALYDKAVTTLLAAPFDQTSFVVPNTVTRLDTYVFFGDTLLASIELPANLTTLGDMIFRDCVNLKKIIVKNTSPITISSMAFYDAEPESNANRIFTNATLFVPKGSLDAYKAANQWKNFTTIKEAGLFYDLGEGHSRAISPNGKYVVGLSGLLWENKGNGDNTVVHIPQSYDLTGVNDDGLIIGTFIDSTYLYNGNPIRNGGFYKNDAWHSLGLGRYGNTADHSAVGVVAGAVTADGWIFGMSGEKDVASKPIPMRWKPDAGGQYTDTLAYRFPEWDIPVSQRTQGARFIGASADGSVACGWAAYQESYGGRRPIVWTSPTKYEILNPELYGEALKVSPNGKYVALYTGNKAAVYDVDNTQLTVFGVSGTQARAVSDNGTVVGYRSTSGGGKKGFVWSNKLGYVELKEFIERFAPEITLPAGFTFDAPENSSTEDFPEAISADGLTFVGHRTVSNVRKAWAFVLAAPMDLLSRPYDVAASVDPLTRNVVKLSWSAPTDIGSHFLDYFHVYRNGEYIGRVDANGERPTSYTDENAPTGYVNYSISAVYDETSEGTYSESGKSEAVTATVVDTYDLPFYEGFEGNYQENYWETLVSADYTWSQIIGGYNAPNGKAGLFHATGTGKAYSQTLTSKPLDGTGKDKITVSFLYEILKERTIGVRDTVHLEVSADAYATAWNTVQSYVLVDSTTWTPQSLDITQWAKDKIFKIRFRAVSGQNRAVKTFIIDEFAVSADPVSGIQGVKARKKTSGEVEVVWQDPSGSYGLTYAQTEKSYDIGNNGVPFIVVNRFNTDSLQAYKDLSLTSITAYINRKNRNARVDTKLGLAVFVDGVRVVTQAVGNFRENAWNTFPLATPVKIADVTRELRFGIDVLEHDSLTLPIATDCEYSISGYGDVFTEDNGATWDDLTSWSRMGNWCLIGNVRSEQASIERADGVLGYEIYRNGEKIYNEYGLTYEQIFIDKTTLPDPCYTVKAYYRIGGFADVSEAGCVNNLEDGLSKVSTEEIVVYPNPATDVVYIQTASDQKPEIRVSTVLGEQLLHTTSNRIDLSDYAKGIYLLQVNGKTVKVMKK